jgi:hypothetical protein
MDQKMRHGFLLRTGRLMTSPVSSWSRFAGSSLPFRASSAISPTFIARLIKGCRVDVRAGFQDFRENQSTFNALTSIFADRSAPRARFSAAIGEPNAQAEDQVRR